MSIEESILKLTSAMERLAAAVEASLPQASAPAATKPDATKPKAEPAAPAPAEPELPTGNAAVMPAAIAQADAARKAAVIAEANAALASARAAEVPTYDSTRALMLQVVEKFGRDEAVTILGACGLQDLKKGTAEHFVKVTAAALAKLA